MNWEAPAGGVCTCCNKPIAPRRPSLLAQAKADRSTLEELKVRCRKYQSIFADGISTLKSTRYELEIAKKRIAIQEQRIAELEERLSHRQSIKRIYW